MLYPFPWGADAADGLRERGRLLFGIGAQILHDLGVRKMLLLTNHPVKRAAIEGFGLEITDRIPMRDFSKGMARLKTGEASKILLYPNGVK